MRKIALVCVCVCACGTLAVDPPSELASGGADASVDSGVGQPVVIPEPPANCRPASDTIEPAAPVSIPPGATADFAVRGARPVVAITPDGDAVVGWHDADHVRVRLYRDARWLDVETITSPDANSRRFDQTPKVAMRPDGSVVVAYYESASTTRTHQNVVCTRERDSSAAWSAVSTLAVTGIGWWQDPSPPVFKLAADGAGNVTALVNADRDHGGLLAFRASAGGRFGEPTPLTTAYLWNVAVAVDASGQAAALWDEGGSSGSAKVAVFSPDAGWGPIESPGLGDARLSATPDRDGSVSVLGSRFVDAGAHVQVATRARDGRWSAVTDFPDFPSSFASIVADDVGRAMVSGSSWVSDCKVTSGVVRRDASGKWGATEAIPGSPPGWTAIEESALSHSGHGLVTWRDQKPSGGPGCISLGTYLSWISPTGAWLPPMLLDSEADGDTALALTPSGRALVAWSHGDRVLVRWIDPP